VLFGNKAFGLYMSTRKASRGTSPCAVLIKLLSCSESNLKYFNTEYTLISFKFVTPKRTKVRPQSILDVFIASKMPRAFSKDLRMRAVHLFHPFHPFHPFHKISFIPLSALFSNWLRHHCRRCRGLDLVWKI
jgi:hypothetical protein